MELTPYSNARPLFASLVNWVGEFHQNRLAAYTLYEAMYWNDSSAFEIKKRGSEDALIRVSTAMTVVETINRYTAPKIDLVASADSESVRQEAQNFLNAFMKRERFRSRFGSAKRYGLIHGDWIWHVTGDVDRPEGSRVSLEPIDPATYFPILDDDNNVIGAHIAYPQTVEGEVRMYRLTYRKVTEAPGPSPITIEEAWYKLDEWGGPDVKQGNPIEQIRSIETFPGDIDHIPLYHIPNTDAPEEMWGSSELRGHEGEITGINQAVNDLDHALALHGLGLYVTDSGAPIDDNGNEVPWRLGPSRVVEIPPGTDFERLSGVTGRLPALDHINYLHERLEEGVVMPAVARGRVDVSTAESGIAMLLQFGPLLSKAEEKELIVTDVLTQMFFDLKKWWAVYDRQTLDETVSIDPVYGPKIPINRSERFTEILRMFSEGIVPAQWALAELSKLGYDFGDVQVLYNLVLEEKMASAEAELGAFEGRIEEELSGDASA